MTVTETMVELAANAIHREAKLHGDRGGAANCYELARAALTAALSDMVVVPREPTIEMCHAAADFHADGCWDASDQSLFGGIYKAMIAAAPAVSPGGWQDIATAPKDGREIEVKYLSDDPRKVRWSQSHYGTGWHLVDSNGAAILRFDPTHWRAAPPPSPPVGGKE